MKRCGRDATSIDGSIQNEARRAAGAKSIATKLDKKNGRRSLFVCKELARMHPDKKGYEKQISQFLGTNSLRVQKISKQ